MKTILEMDEDAYGDLVVFLQEAATKAIQEANWEEAQRRLDLCKLLG